MKPRHILFILFACAALGSCAASRPTSYASYAYDADESSSIFPNSGQYIGKTVFLIFDTPNRNMEAHLDTITDEPKESYRARYETFFRDSSNKSKAIGLGNEIFISSRTSFDAKDYHLFLGYTPDGILAGGTHGTKLFGFWAIDTMTEISTGKSFSGYEIHDLITENAVPVYGIFHFTGYAETKSYVMTNTEFYHAWVVRPVPIRVVNQETREAVQESTGPSLGETLIGGLLNAIFSGSDDSGSSSSSTEKKEDPEPTKKKGRINSGDDRGRKY